MPTARGLVEAMRNDHELLHLYLGDETFDEMGHAYVKARPSEHPNLRWFSQGLPDFLKSAGSRTATIPALSDLAALEKALNEAFEGAKEGPVLALEAMAGLCPGAVERADVSAAPQRLAGSIFQNQCVGDLDGAQERRNAAGSGTA